MKRLWVLGLGLACSVGFAQTPVSVLPGTTVKSEPKKDAATPSTIIPPAGAGVAPTSLPALPILVNAEPAHSGLQPLSSLLAAPLPTIPLLSPYASGAPCAPACQPAVPCGAPLFSGKRQAGASCLDRIMTWLCYQPPAGCMPGPEANPYQAPLRAYFPCAPMKNPGYPANCANGTCRVGSGGVACAAKPTSEFWNRWGIAAIRGQNCTDPACKAPINKGYGAWQVPSKMPATTGELGFGCAPMAIPLPANCVGNPAGTIPPCQSCATKPRCAQTSLDQLAGLFHPYGQCKDGSCGTTVNTAPPTATVPVIMGYYQPSKQGYRFAHPTSPTGTPAAHTAPIMPAAATAPAPTGLPPLAQVAR
ncbi:MAG: hypothetical protein ACRC8S_10535 [Fimbriiglobus sp.]